MYFIFPPHLTSASALPAYFIGNISAKNIKKIHSCVSKLQQVWLSIHAFSRVFQSCTSVPRFPVPRLCHVFRSRVFSPPPLSSGHVFSGCERAFIYIIVLCISIVVAIQCKVQHIHHVSYKNFHAIMTPDSSILFEVERTYSKQSRGIIYSTLFAIYTAAIENKHRKVHKVI